MIGIVIGTRPEALKMAPIVRALVATGTPHKVIALEQHTDLLHQHLAEAEIKPDIVVSGLRMSVRPASADLNVLLGNIFNATCGDWFSKEYFSLILVQGDTTTALGAALAAHMRGMPIGHVEAGLRTLGSNKPFPEESNRRLIGQIADVHFCPTETALKKTLESAKHGSTCYVTGNTSVDQLIHDLARPATTFPSQLPRPLGPRSVLVTMHRRENVLSGNIVRVAQELCKLVDETKDETYPFEIVWPLHPNPQISYLLANKTNGKIRYIKAQDHVQFVHMLKNCACVVTDSGGVLEEAVTLGKRTLVVRDETERPEAFDEGVAEMVPEAQVHELAARVRDALQRNDPSPSTAFGTGAAGALIAELSQQFVENLRR